MDDLLSAFDPLHQPSSATSTKMGPSGTRAGEERRKDPLFPTSTSAASSKSNSNSNLTATNARGMNGHHNDHLPKPSTAHAVPINLSQAPLDLLSFDDDPSSPTRAAAAEESSGSRNGSSSLGDSQAHNPVVAPTSTTAARDSIQRKAAARQQDILQELDKAEQPIDWQSRSSSSASTSTSRQTQAAASQRTSFPSLEQQQSQSQSQSQSHPKPGPPSSRRSGFSPPRRLSRNGLMHDDALHAVRESAHAQSPSSPTRPSQVIITQEPSELFYPSSPPDGTTLESMRRSSYFNTISGSGAHHSSARSALSPSTFISTGPHSSAQDHHLSSSSTTNIPTANSECSPSRGHRAEQQHAFTIPPPGSSMPSQDDLSGQEMASRSSTWTTRINPALFQSRSSEKQHTATAKPRRALMDLDFSKDPYSKRPGTTETKTSMSAPATTASLPSSIDTDPLPPILLKVPPAAESSRRIMTEDIADAIRPALSSRIRLCKTWTLVYSLDAHGTSLTTLYSRVQAGLQKTAGGCVLLVKDMENNIFGAYVNEAFKKSDGYYGNGECFLWKVESFPSGEDFRLGPIVKAFKWTGRNDYMILSDSSFLSVGGGDGRYGLWLDASFDKGVSATCPAFNNEVLCATKDGSEEEGKFEIQAVECWAVG